MECDHTAESQQADELLDDALSPETTGSSKRRAAFKQQLAEFEATVDTNPNALGRALTYVIADSLEIAAIYGDVLKHELRKSPATLDDLERVKGPLNDYFRATRQADRYANLGQRLEEAQSRSVDASQTKRSGRQRPTIQYGAN